MKTQCALGCGNTVDSEKPGVYQWVSGWERLRAQGGTNALRARRPAMKFACHPCVEKLVKVGTYQQPLWSDE